MLKQMAIAALLSVPVFAQTHPPVVHFEQSDEIRKIKCKVQVPEISAARYSSTLISPLQAI